MDSSRRAIVPVTVACGGDFVYRHVDAECRRRLAHDTAHHVASDGQPGDGSHDSAGVSGDPARRSAGGHGRPETLSAGHARLDGSGCGFVGNPYLET